MKYLEETRVGIVTSTYARNHEDCQVPWMRELNKRLKTEVDHLVVMAPTFKGLKEHKIDGVPVKRFRYAPTSLEALTHDEGAPSKVKSFKNKLVAASYLLCGICSVLEWCITERITVLHIHWPFPHAVWALLPKYILGVRVIAMSHGAELAMARRSFPVRIALRGLIKTVDVCCANSSHTAAEVAKVSGRTAKIIPYGATVKEGVRSVKENEVPLILFCGRLIQRKGIDVLLNALPTVLEQTKVQVVITGEGDRKAEWEKLTEDLGLGEVVEFPGFVSNERLGQLYRDCDLYVHPAIFDDRGDTEGLGVVLIEALVNKKPVIASAVGGIIDVIKDQDTGILVPEKDPTALSKAIIEVVHNPEMGKELGERGFQHVQTFFNWDRVTQETSELYEFLVRGDTQNEVAPSNLQNA